MVEVAADRGTVVEAWVAADGWVTSLDSPLSTGGCGLSEAVEESLPEGVPVDDSSPTADPSPGG
jgi:hypothetical protein